MKIAVDSWTLASRFRCQGTYVYTHNLLREFKKLVRKDTTVRFSLFASNRNGNDGPDVLMKLNREHGYQHASNQVHAGKTGANANKEQNADAA